jgi:phosphonate transport system substrate-binding protein
VKNLFRSLVPELAFVAATLAVSQAQAQVGPTLKLGVVPQFPVVETHTTWHPIAVAIESACGQHVQLTLSKSIPDFEQEFLRADFDLVYLNPYHMVMARKAQGYVPLLREGKRQLKGVLVVRADSQVQRIGDLDGQQVSFPAPNAFGASLYMRALLEREFKIRVKPNYAKTHNNAYRQVIVGESAAAGGVGATLRSETPETQALLRVLYETPPVAPHPLAAHPRVSVKLRTCITAALTTALEGSELRGQLAQVQMAHPITADYARDYLPLERLALERYVVLNEIPSPQNQ